MRKYRQRRVYLNYDKTKYVDVRVYSHLSDMREAYCSWLGKEHTGFLEDGYGAHTPEIRIRYPERKLSPKTGIILLAAKYLQEDIVSHEFLHAVLWAYKHTRRKKQYPIVIKSMKQEEEIAHNLTYALQQFRRLKSLRKR